MVRLVFSLQRCGNNAGVIFPVKNSDASTCAFFTIALTGTVGINDKGVFVILAIEEEEEDVVFVVGDNCDVGLDEDVAPISDSSPSGCGRQ